MHRVQVISVTAISQCIRVLLSAYELTRCIVSFRMQHFDELTNIKPLNSVPTWNTFAVRSRDRVAQCCDTFNATRHKMEILIKLKTKFCCLNELLVWVFGAQKDRPLRVFFHFSRLHRLNWNKYLCHTINGGRYRVDNIMCWWWWWWWWWLVEQEKPDFSIGNLCKSRIECAINNLAISNLSYRKPKQIDFYAIQHWPVPSPLPSLVRVSELCVLCFESIDI